MSDKGPELSEVISAMFGDQDSEVARLLIEIFEIAKNTSVKTVSAGLEEEKIQGYTAEQWQEIIDGGYLCEFSFDENFGDTLVSTLESHDEPNGRFFEKDRGSWTMCRPAQIKGVMRPIFVEPVEPSVSCTFFSVDGLPISPDGLDMTNCGFIFNHWVDKAKENGATKYIEV